MKNEKKMVVICVAQRVHRFTSRTHISDSITEDQPDAGHDLFNTLWILSLTSEHSQLTRSNWPMPQVDLCNVQLCL